MKNNPFKNIGTGDIWIEDDIFDINDEETIIDVSKDIIDDTKQETDPFIDFTVTKPKKRHNNKD